MNDDILDQAGRSQLHYLARDGDIAEMRALIADGSDVNLRDDNGMTPLHIAAQEQQADAVRLLLESRATCDVADAHGNAPLMNAIFNYRGDGDCIRILRQAGADPLRVNLHGQTPLGLARLIGNTDVAKFFTDLE